jgi:adenylate kinase
MRKYIMIGPQGSGKGTQATLFVEDLDLVHIGVGDILRWHVQSHTKIGARVKRAVDGGELVSDDLVDDVVKHRLDQHDWNYGFALDGFPRNATQARFFLESYDIDAVIHLDVPDAVVMQRILSRRLCSRCGLDYNLIQHRPAAPDRCDVCNGPLIPRADDTPEIARERVRTYREKTQPILELFQAKELVFTVDGTKPPLEVHAELRRRLALPACVHGPKDTRA